MTSRRPRDQESEESLRRAERIRRIKSAVKPTILLLIVAAGYWAIRSRQGETPDCTAHEGVGQALSYLELEPLTGNAPPISLEDIQGRVTLLNFWGTWCPPCRTELPHLAQLRKRFAAQRDFQLLAVSCLAGGQPFDPQSLREETVKLLKRLKLDLPTYFDPENATLIMLGNHVGLDSFPTTLLLDRRGVICAVWVGYRPGVEIEMERFVGKILDEQRR